MNVFFSAAYTCGGKPMSLLNISGNANTTWLPFTTTWTANRTNPMLIFGFDASSSVYFIIDDVSIVDNMNTSVQLLTNPSFDNSSSGPIGWIPWCSQTCTDGTAGNVSSSGCRTSRCYIGACGGASGVEYLVQAFPTIIGRTYNITFWYQRVKFGVSGGVVTLYAGII